MKDNVFLSENAYIAKPLKHPERLIKKLNKGKVLKSFYVVYMPLDKEKPEIIESRFFSFKYMRSVEREVICLCKEMDDAYEYIRCLTQASVMFFDDVRFKETLEKITPELIDSLFYKDTEE